MATVEEKGEVRRIGKGRVREWLNRLAWKASVFERVPWVRIPPLPQEFARSI